MNRNKLYENLDEAYFAVIMDQYTEEEGKRLLEEYRQQQDDPAMQVPDSLRQRSLDTIEQEFARRKKQHNVRRLQRGLSRVAIIVLAFLTLGTITVFSVDAIRTRLFNTAMEHRETHTSVSAVPRDETQEMPEIPMPTWLPEGYAFVEQVRTIPDQVIIEYKHEDGSKLEYIWENGTSTYMNVDTENATFIDELTINANDAIIAFKETWLLFWIDYTQDCMFQLYGGENLTEEEIIKIAESIQ